MFFHIMFIIGCRLSNLNNQLEIESIQDRPKQQITKQRCEADRLQNKHSAFDCPTNSYQSLFVKFFLMIFSFAPAYVNRNIQSNKRIKLDNKAELNILIFTGKVFHQTMEAL